MNKDKQLEIIKKYPNLFGTNEICPFSKYGIEVDDGWYILVDMLCEALTNLQHDALEPFTLEVLQIKEKWGGLNFYYHTDAKPYMCDAINAFVSSISKLSYRTCEKCGSTENVGIQTKGWIKTGCIKCKDTSTFTRPESWLPLEQAKEQLPFLKF